ncbi:ankyrin repeat domain-containing protein [Catellatospora methionotrophica]|uniref:ankyrin repeat domain-containing protein n=1 Tax=Catellatospora methionotrophica TaxID=121620 RepID=UPI00340D2A75
MTATIDPADPLAVAAAVQAIHDGDVAGLRRLLTEQAHLATARLGNDQPCGMTRTLLHVATDWPGHYPNGPATVAALVAAGADVNARFTGPHTETPLHWAASSDDVAVLDALLDAGADIEAGGGVIGNGTPLADAVAFGQWNTARRLLERGAQPNLWQAAGLGLLAHVQAACTADPPPPADEITGAFWLACHGGQEATSAYLLDLGADLNWIGYDQLTPLDAARRSSAHQLAEWLTARGALTADQVGPAHG